MCISFQGMSQLELEGEVQDALKHAKDNSLKDIDGANKLNCILQLTGFSDLVYAKVYVTFLIMTLSLMLLLSIE